MPIAAIAAPLLGAAAGWGLAGTAAGALAGAGIGSMIGGTLAQTGAAESAAEAQERAAGQASATQLEMYYRSREDLAPWSEAGRNALAQYQGMVQAGPGVFEESPGYQFRLGEGVKALERGAAARGGLLSGRQQKALTQYGQGIGSQEYSNWLDQYYRSLEPSRWLAGTGQSAAAQQGAWGQATGGDVARNQLAVGQAQAGGYINQANALTGFLGGAMQNAPYFMNALNQGGSGYVPSTISPSGIPPGDWELYGLM